MVRFSLLASSVLLGTAVAVPITQDDSADSDAGLLEYLNLDPSDIKFQPIKGMPTLQDLNITTTDLLDPAWRLSNGLPDPRNSSPNRKSTKETTKDLQKRVEPQCYPYSQNAHISAAYACRDYLNSLGTTPCVVRGYLQQTAHCHADIASVGVAFVYGMPSYPSSYASSYCSDVARGLNWVLDNCLSQNPCRCGVAGQNAAWGNGGHVVSVQNS
ncbi:hypothetical protein CC79DRAFT_1337986 [Sarocladium strictum]